MTRALCLIAAAFVLAITSSPSAASIASGPLVATDASHIVVLEYEAWFGPNAVTFQNAEAMPLLQSADMQSVGGGYDSADPHVIAQHVAWMEYMGIDAVTVDLTNNVGCIFSTGPVSREFCNPDTDAFRQSNRSIQSNTANLYPAWTALGTPLKIIPLLGCQTQLDLNKGADGKSGFQKEIEFFGRLDSRYPNLSVIYAGHPLMLVYVGTPVDPTVLYRTQAVLRESGLDTRYTFRIVGGYLESQPTFWANPNEIPTGPIRIASQYRFWSVVDRLKPAFRYFPTYSVTPHDPRRAENLTVSLATAGQTGWGCPQPTYCPDASLRYADGSDFERYAPQYATLTSFMRLAREIDPTFLIVDQFNEFAQPDEGWNADTSDDAEPTRLPGGWGYSGIDAIREAIQAYRR